MSEVRQEEARRLFGTGAAVIFKGSGFYQTDYRSESYKSAAKADQEAAKTNTADTASPDGTSTSAKTPKETKPAKKASKKDT